VGAAGEKIGSNSSGEGVRTLTTSDIATAPAANCAAIPTLALAPLPRFIVPVVGT
jgi:hypothetical protein